MFRLVVIFGEAAHARVLVEDLDHVVGQFAWCQDPQVQHPDSVQPRRGLLVTELDLVAALDNVERRVRK
jgi:hypothetical protein